MTIKDSNDRDENPAADVLRREVLKYAGVGSGAAVASLLAGSAQAAEPPKMQVAAANVERATRGMPSPKIKDMHVINIWGGGLQNTCVVKVLTDQDGLYGYGCASVTAPGGRSKLVKVMVEEYMKPFLVGRRTDAIEDIWQLCYQSSYYKNDNVQNAAIGGICDALWDIKGRQANMPVYQLVGGKCRQAADVYVHSLARPFEPKVVVENSKKLVAQGFRNVQVDMFGRDAEVKGLHEKPTFDRDLLMRKTLAAFEAFRKEMPPNIRLGCDVHSLLNATRSLQFCKASEAFHPWYWMEDPLPPEEQGMLAIIRQQTSVPISIGELYNNPAEWRPVIDQRLIDYIRIHVSHIGGFTAARKVAAFAENYNVMTGWHGNPCSPVGHMTNLTLDLTVPNFGIHERHFVEYPDPVKEVVTKGLMEIKDGYAWINEDPGWGIEINEAAAAKQSGIETSNEVRVADGGIVLGV